MREKIIKSVLDEKVIVIVRGVEKEKLIPLAEAMYNGGIRFIEVTYSANGAVSDEVIGSYITSIYKHFNGNMFVGAGTVIKASQVDMTLASGGQFIISPDTYSDVIKRTVELGLVSMPGAMTPSEIQQAHRAGADFVKVFPTVSLGADYIKAITAPLSHINLLAVGGVNLTNIRDYLKAGVKGFGIGSNIVDKKLIAENNFSEITELAKRYVDAVNY